MQLLVVLVVVALALAGVAILAARGGDESLPRAGARVWLGVVPGVLGAVLVLVLQTDLVPDDVEPVMTVSGVAVLLVAAAVGSWWVFVRS